MKQSMQILAGLLLGSAPVLAFPSFDPAVLNDALVRRALDEALVKRADNDTPVFDPKVQLVDTTGLHAWQAPGPNDVRGPCPGLNAMANHGYLPRSGYSTIPQFIEACMTVYGMGVSLATVLAAYGAAIDGSVVGWSIGGGPNVGIGGSHGNYETDSSPLRADLNQYGSNTDLVLSQFQALYDMQPDADTADYNLEVLRDFRQVRFQESIEKNPLFFYSAFSGVIVSAAAFQFIPRLMSNHSADFPDGKLNKEVLKSFMSIQGPEDNLTWVPGNERIPDNWYRRSLSHSPYEFGPFHDDMLYLGATQPEILTPGCNTGAVNSYTPINSTGTADQTDPLCVGLAAMLASLGTRAPGAAVGQIITPVQNMLGCDTVPTLNMTVEEACPGYSFYGGPAGPVADGAIQN